MKTEYNGLTITGTPAEMLELANLITAPKPDEPKPEPKPAPKKSTKKDLDMGKVRALRDAGWSLAAIAEEMGVSQQTIANRLMKDVK